MGATHAPGRRKRKLAHEINVVPYIDVMLVLLIIFMITAPLLTQGIEVNLPETGADAMSTTQEPASLYIDAKGRYYLDIGTGTGKPLSDDEVVRRVKAYLKSDPAKMVLVKGDTRVDGQRDRLVRRRQRLGGGVGQLHLDALRQQRCGDHEDDQQHEHHVDIRHDVDLGRQLAPLAHLHLSALRPGAGRARGCR